MKTHLLCLLSPKQGSTLRKRKMYEEFLSKVSILGQWPRPCVRRSVPRGLLQSRLSPACWPQLFPRSLHAWQVQRPW